MSHVDESAARLTHLEPGTIFAGYRIEGMLDRGGMGVVYKATDGDLDRTVALKIIAPEHTQNPDAVTRFKAEARLAASLEHPNIVPIHRGGEFNGVLYLAMRFVPGTNLRAVIDQGQLDIPRIRRIVASVAAALDAAHERGLVHRDVKPANILLSGSGEHEQVYLTDFGLTKRLGSAGSLTRTGAWVGTPDYVAPEQIQAGPVDGRADIYSLGCVLYEMLTGSVAYPKDNDMAKLWAHVQDPPPAPSLKRPGLPKEFDDVVARATAKNPADRYQKASDLVAALDRAIADQSGGVASDGLSVTRAPAAAPVQPAPSAPADHDVFVSEAGASAAAASASAAPAPASAQPPPSAQPPASGPAGPTGGAPGGPGWRPPPPPRRKRWPILVGVGVVAAGVVAAVVVASGGSSDDKSSQDLGERVPATLSPVPTNKVDGVGAATVRLKGDVATVSIKAHGLLNGEPHVMHIHAGEKGACPTVDAAREHNNHLSISTLDGAAFYGHPRVALTTRGDFSVISILEFARFPHTGNITYKRTLHLRPRTARFIRRNLASLIIHGIDYNGNGRYDDTLGGSDLNPALPGEATAPALCGELLAGRAAQENAKGGTTVYTASLGLPPGTPTRDPSTWICRLRGNSIS
jgi:serine/threonine-protein kinase